MNIEKYFLDFLDQKDYGLEKEIINFAEHFEIPYLNRIKAQFLETVVRIKSPDKAFEIGTGSGYSTYKIIKSLPAKGRLVSIDYNFHRVECFYENIFSKFSVSLKNKLCVYPLESFYVIDIFQRIGEKFDFIFVDAVKRDYVKYLIELEKLLNINGILIFDNITYNKQIIDRSAKRSENYIKGIKLVDEFNRKLISNKNLLTSFIAIGDGLSFSVKIK
jgi:caffeoyl-CoA O-methyltransferase